MAQLNVRSAASRFSSKPRDEMHDLLGYRLQRRRIETYAFEAIFDAVGQHIAGGVADRSGIMQTRIWATDRAIRGVVSRTLPSRLWSENRIFAATRRASRSTRLRCGAGHQKRAQHQGVIGKRYVDSVEARGEYVWPAASGLSPECSGRDPGLHNVRDQAITAAHVQHAAVGRDKAHEPIEQDSGYDAQKTALFQCGRIHSCVNGFALSLAEGAVYLSDNRSS